VKKPRRDVCGRGGGIFERRLVRFFGDGGVWGDFSGGGILKQTLILKDRPGRTDPYPIIDYQEFFARNFSIILFVTS
jgi:hypothetical protein